MASTTLVTFLFECPVAARTIELYGSWDNFDKSYHLKCDRRRGARVWSGCFTFQDIICDGDPSNIGPKRDGGLLLGGTYWYYYKVNDDEEHHNPLEPSTTFCPLLPGQRLNVLDIPMESSSASSASNARSNDAFTRNPEDRYLTPVPPQPLGPPRLSDLCVERYQVPMLSYEAPRSATYPAPERSLSPGFTRYTKSASTSPMFPSGAVFPDFRSLKEKVSPSKRCTSQNRGYSGQRSVRDLQIGSPVLISTTAEDINIVPLPSVQVPKTPSSLPASVTAKLKEFSPLGSHPVRLSQDIVFASSESTLKRSHSQGQPMATPEIQFTPGRIRANSADTRRTRHYHLFPNEPWISSPKLPTSVDSDDEEDVPAPVLARPSQSLNAPSTSLAERPASRHGGDKDSSLRKTPFDKELPSLPRYLVPAPLFACSSAAPSPTLSEEPEEDDYDKEEELHFSTPIERRSHFSTWSVDSVPIDSPTSDEDAIHSPTFSSLTSSSSIAGSPKRFSIHSAQSNEESRHDYDSDTEDTQAGHQEPLESADLDDVDGTLVLRLPVPSFGPNIFQFDLQHSESIPRRQAACFGSSGFQEYSLPIDYTASQATIVKESPPSEPTIGHESESSVSQLEKLTNDFSFLGGVVH